MKTLRSILMACLVLAGLLVAQVAMAATVVNRHLADFKTLQAQRKSIHQQMRANPAQIPTLMKALQANRAQERAMRLSVIKARKAARKGN